MAAPHRTGRSTLLVSPNSILANALLRTIDILRPRVHATRPARIEFVVGTQINGAPHLGTNLVQAAAFLLAKLARREFSVDATVRFSALDNAPHDVVLDPETHTAYQQTYFHALGKDGIGDLIERYYRTFFDSLAEATGTDYTVETYTDQQATPGYRAEFLRTLERLDDLRWWLAPSHGTVHIRVPCPDCGWAEKRADRTKLARLDDRWPPPPRRCRSGSSPHRFSRRLARSCPSRCCVSRAAACCRQTSSPGCSTPPAGPAASIITSTR